MSYDIEKKTRQALAYVRNAIADSFEEMASIGTTNIKRETPVRTGNLKQSNKTEIEPEELDFINDADYAAFVELGTYRQSANPFMRRGIAKSIPEFSRIIVRNLKV